MEKNKVLVGDYTVDVVKQEIEKISCLRRGGRIVYMVPPVPFCEAVRRIWRVIGQIKRAQKLIRAG